MPLTEPAAVIPTQTLPAPSLVGSPAPSLGRAASNWKRASRSSIESQSLAAQGPASREAGPFSCHGSSFVSCCQVGKICVMSLILLALLLGAAQEPLPCDQAQSAMLAENGRRAVAQKKYET